MTKGFLRFVLLGTFISVCVSAGAQTGGAYGSYSPYSVFGIGDIAKEGTAFNKGMGGVGVATRNRRYINTMNPASLSAIDSSSFMADFGLAEDNRVFRQTGGSNPITSGNNTFNINDFVIAFPVYRSFCMMVGISPFSNIGYDFSSYESDAQIVGNTSPINFTHYGEGSVYQIFWGAGVEFWKRLSVGAELIYYFGTLDKVGIISFYDSAYQNVTGGTEIVARGTTVKLGAQYTQPFAGNVRMTVGATYRMGTKLRGTTDIYQYGEQSSIRDTISYSTLNNKENLRIGDELGFGVSIRKGDKWTLEIDYLRSDWSRSGFDNAAYTGTQNDGFSPRVANSLRVGFDFTPNRNDIRYYMRRCTYRAGVYYDQSYYSYYGDLVSSKGVTLGITFPVYRLYNGLTLGVDFGKKGSVRNNMVREMYATINVGFNIHDLWFHKPKYE